MPCRGMLYAKCGLYAALASGMDRPTRRKRASTACMVAVMAASSRGTRRDIPGVVVFTGFFQPLALKTSVETKLIIVHVSVSPSVYGIRSIISTRQDAKRLEGAHRTPHFSVQ